MWPIFWIVINSKSVPYNCKHETVRKKLNILARTFFDQWLRTNSKSNLNFDSNLPFNWLLIFDFAISTADVIGWYFVSLEKNL